MSCSNNENNCAICFEPLCSSISPIGVVNPCGHLFHQACYKQWENTNKQRQRNSARQNRKNVQVKCPTCNTKSKGFIGVYLNMESFFVDDGGDSDSDSDSDSDDDDDGNGNDGQNLNNEGKGLSRKDTGNDDNLNVSNQGQETSTVDSGGQVTVCLLSDSDDDRIINNQIQLGENENGSENSNSSREQQNQQSAQSSTSSATTSRSTSSSSSTKTLDTAASDSNDKKLRKYKLKVKSLKKHNESLKQTAQLLNDLQKKYTEKEKELKSLETDMEEIRNLRYIDVSTIERLQYSMNEMEKMIMAKDERILSLNDKLGEAMLNIKNIKGYYANKEKQSERQNMGEIDEVLKNFEKSKKQRDELMTECQSKEKEIALLKRDRDRWMNMATRNDLHTHSQISLMKRKDDMDMTSSSSSSTSRATCRRAKKRAIEETMEEFEKNRIEEAQVQKEKQSKEDYRKMMRKSSMQARKVNKAMAEKMHSISPWDSPATEAKKASTKSNETQHVQNHTLLQRRVKKKSTFPKLSSSYESRDMNSSSKQHHPSRREIKRNKHRDSSKNNDIRNMFKRQL